MRNIYIADKIQVIQNGLEALYDRLDARYGAYNKADILLLVNDRELVNCIYGTPVKINLMTVHDPTHQNHALMLVRTIYQDDVHPDTGEPFTVTKHMVYFTMGSVPDRVQHDPISHTVTIQTVIPELTVLDPELIVAVNLIEQKQVGVRLDNLSTQGGEV